MEIFHPLDAEVRDPRGPGGIGDYFVFCRGIATSLYTPQEHASVSLELLARRIPTGYAQLFLLEKIGVFEASNPGVRALEADVDLVSVGDAGEIDHDGLYGLVEVGGRARTRLSIDGVRALETLRDWCAASGTRVLVGRVLDELMWH